MSEDRNVLFATAFMVGYAPPNSITSQPAHHRSKSPPPHKLSVRKAYFRTRKIVKIKEKITDHALSLLAGILHPHHLLDSQTKEELHWELKLQKPIKLQCLSRGTSSKICKYQLSLLEFDHMKLSAGILSPMEKAPCAKQVSDCSTIKQASHRVGKRSFSAVNAFKENDCRMESIRPNGLPSHSPDEIQNFMRKKNHLRSKEKKAALAQAQAAMAAKKERMKVLEMERRARLHTEALNGKGRVETFPRPQWDSSVSASTGELNGPWSRSSYPVSPVDFPLPKPIDADSFSSLSLASKSILESLCGPLVRSRNIQENPCINNCSSLEGAWLHAEGSQEKLDLVNANHNIASSNKSLYQQEIKSPNLSTLTNIQKVCSSHNVKSRNLSSVQSFKTGRKEMRLSLPSSRIIANFEKQQRRELVAGHPLGEAFPKDGQNYTLFQQAYDTEPLSSCGDGTGQIASLSNKRKASTYSFANQNIKSGARKLKMHAKADGLHDGARMPTIPNTGYNTTDNVKESIPCHTRYLTYHLEKFPSRSKREALTEKKRVALLKVLAQQLVIRLDAAESHPSYLLDGNVQAHALLLRSNLEKFQKELHAAVKALEACYSQPSRKKSIGYIVLPSKLERKGNLNQARGFQQEGLNLLQREDALDNQSVLLHHDLSSENTTSATSTLIDYPISQKAKKARQQRVRNGESSKHKCLGPCKEINEEILETKTPDSMFQDLELRLWSICVDSKSEATYKEKRTWDHQLLDRELEKLDAEIKETKMRMARKLFSTHSLADAGSVLSPLSLSPRCSGGATPHLGVWSVSPTIVSGTERSVDMPNLAKEDSEYIHQVQNEPMGASFDEKFPRQSDGSAPEADILQKNEKDVKGDVIIKGDNQVSVNDYIGPCHLVAELPSHVARRDITASSESLKTSTRDLNMEACIALPHVRRVEVSQLAREPSSAEGLTVLFKQGIKENQEILLNSMTEALMQELLDLELSDMLLHGQDVSRSSQLRRMKKEVLEYAKLKSASTGINSHGTDRLQHLPDASRSPCASLSTSPVPTQEAPNVFTAGPLMTYNDFDHWNCQSYHDPMAMKSTSPANATFEIHRLDPFKMTSKRLVDKYVKEILEAQGLLRASNLLEMYSSGKTLSLTLGKQSVDERELDEKLYGQMLVDALCECLDKKYSRFYLPSFFLFLQPCPEDPYLKQTLVYNVNEHADAACEGGFSLEYILEKSLDEEDWKAAHPEMVEVINGISEHVMMDIINSFVRDLMVMRQTTCSQQASRGFIQRGEANLFSLID